MRCKKEHAMMSSYSYLLVLVNHTKSNRLQLLKGISYLAIILLVPILVDPYPETLLQKSLLLTHTILRIFPEHHIITSCSIPGP